MLSRLNKLPRGGHVRDQEKMADVRVFQDRYDQRAEADAARGVHCEALPTFRWMLEELRISLFAQEVGTAYPVSVKRVEKRWGEMGL